MKRCSKCKIEKELFEFGVNKSTKSKLNVYCKSCARENGRQQRKKDLNYAREYDKNYRLKNLEKVKQASREHWHENKEKYKKTRKKYYTENKEEIQKKSKEYYQKTKERRAFCNRKTHLKVNYNLSLEEYSSMAINQNNCCAICNKPETTFLNGKQRKLAVDHDHKTGKIRELLCGDCNTTLGKLNEDIELFNKFIKYLEKHK